MASVKVEEVELDQKPKIIASEEIIQPQKPKIKEFQLIETNPFVLWWKQLFILLKTQAILTFLRNWKATYMTILAPIVFIAILYGIQEIAKNYGTPENLTPIAYSLQGINHCTVGPTKVCVNFIITPDSPETRSIMQIFDDNNKKRGIESPDFQVFPLQGIDLPSETLFYSSTPSESSMYDYILMHPNVTRYGISFSRSGNDFSYQIWFNQSLTANTTQHVDESYGIELTSVMRGLDEAILSYASQENGQSEIELDVSLKDWPTLEIAGLASSVVSQGGPLFFFCSSMINCLLVLNTIVAEKELKLRHGMQMMGLMSSVYWTSWYLINTIIVAAASLILCGFGNAFGFEVFTKTDFGVLFCMFFLLAQAMIFFSFFVSTLVPRVRTATLVGIFVLIIGLVFMLAVFSNSFVGYIWWEEKTAPAAWKILILFPFFNFGKLYLDIATLSVGSYDLGTDTLIAGAGFPWSALYEVLPDKYHPPFGTYHFPIPGQSLNYLVMNCFLYGFLAWYCDNVVPDQFGNRQPLYFFLLPSYWGIHISWFRQWKGVSQAAFETAQSINEDEDVHNERLKALSPTATLTQFGVRLINLRKVYNGGLFSRGNKKVAVANSCWTLTEGRLLALLGQNGAGKSTTINMLCGFSRPTSGDAFIFGHSIKREMHTIRSMMGVCPQHDILFQDLTAKEHIELFAGIKNVPRSELNALMEERLGAVRLLKVKDRPAGTYSGGMKRRLSVAICTIGNPKIIFMDEPTTGMDPVNRRHVWEFIENFKKGRAIILTTHSMEEADILGDDIAIMALGKLRAFGSSVQLKGKFGAGYRISLVCEQGQGESVQQAVASILPSAILEDNSADALIFKIPNDEVSNIPTLVSQLEKSLIAGVREWGISQSTLEEVFLKLIREVNPTNGKAAPKKQ